MSEININYGIINKIGNREGELKYLEDALLYREKSNLSNIIAAEVVNEILENALNIAIGARNIGFSWTNTNTSPNSSLSLCYSTGSPDMEYDGQEELDCQTNTTTCSDVIGDIVDRIGSSTPPSIEELVEGLNSISVNKESPMKPQTAPLEKEMKMLLSEMMSPTYDVVNYDSVPEKNGIGDQLSETYKNGTESTKVASEILHKDTIASKPVEKKSRVTDLVKNSPSIISKILMIDNDSKQNQDSWEETSEEILQVIELDHVKPGEESFRAYRKFLPENVPLPEDDTLILEPFPKDDTLDMIDLSSEIFKREEILLDLEADNSCKREAKSRNNDECLRCTRKDKNECPRDEKLNNEEHAKSQNVMGDAPQTFDKKIKKKKWNIGTRLWGFFKKSSKHQIQCPSPTNQQ